VARLWIVSKIDGNCGMTDSIVQTPEFVTLVGASRASEGQLAQALAIAPYLIAADGGAELSRNYGVAPKMLIGDFDSIDKTTLQEIPENRRIHVAEQSTTDFDKCLTLVRAPLILGVGFLGGRLDHQLAAFSTLLRHPEQCCILLGERDLILAIHRPIELALEPGSRLSLFPMLPCQGKSEGLEWPVDGLKFAPNAKIGTSNRVIDGPVRLEFQTPGMLLILPLAALAAVVGALGGR